MLFRSEVDTLRHMVRAGYRHPWLEDAQAAEQRQLSVRNAMAMARECVAMRYAVVIDDVVYGPVVDMYRLAMDELGAPLQFVTLLPRLDVALARDAVDRVHAVLTQTLGYAPVERVSNDLTAPQRAYAKRLHPVGHVFDVHWQLSSPRVFSAMPSFEALEAESVELPECGPAARVPSPVHALLIACVHRVAHHLDAHDLKWLLDIHLLAGGQAAGAATARPRLTPADWDGFVELARASQVGAVCHRSLRTAAEQLGTPIPAHILSGESLTKFSRTEPSALYLHAQPMLRRVVADARTLPWSGRLRLVREHLFPPEPYMRTTWAPGSSAPLSALYATRAVLGLAGWLRRR